jgi:hypothetical protein
LTRTNFEGHSAARSEETGRFSSLITKGLDWLAGYGIVRTVRNAAGALLRTDRCHLQSLLWCLRPHLLWNNLRTVQQSPHVPNDPDTSQAWPPRRTSSGSGMSSAIFDPVYNH